MGSHSFRGVVAPHFASVAGTRLVVDGIHCASVMMGATITEAVVVVIVAVVMAMIKSREYLLTASTPSVN
jgi:hypothetical protein